MSFYCPASRTVCLMLSACLVKSRVRKYISRSPSKKKRMNNNKWSLKRETRVDEDELSLSLYWLFTRHLFLLGSQSEQREAKSREGPKILLHQHHLFLMKGYRVYVMRVNPHSSEDKRSCKQSLSPFLSHSWLFFLYFRSSDEEEWPMKETKTSQVCFHLLWHKEYNTRRNDREISLVSLLLFLLVTPFLPLSFFLRYHDVSGICSLTQTIFKMWDRFTPECLIRFFLSLSQSHEPDSY